MTEQLQGVGAAKTVPTPTADGPLVARAIAAGLTNARGVARAVEKKDGDYADCEDLAAVWERLAVASNPRADAMRREAREREFS